MLWPNLSVYGLRASVLVAETDSGTNTQYLITAENDRFALSIESLGFMYDSRQNVWFSGTDIDVAHLQKVFPRTTFDDLPNDEIVTFVDYRTAAPTTVPEAAATIDVAQDDEGPAATADAAPESAINPAPSPIEEVPHDDNPTDPTGPAATGDDGPGDVSSGVSHDEHDESNDGRDTTESIRAEGEGTLAEVSADQGGEAQGDGSVDGDAGAGAGADGAAGGPADGGPGADQPDASGRVSGAGGSPDGLEESGRGDRAEAVHPSGAGERQPERLNPGHFRITDEIDRPGGYAAKTRFQETLAAIDVLQAVEANPDAPIDQGQRSALARYAGFGGMPDVFGYSPNWVHERDALMARINAGGDDYRLMRSTIVNAHYTSPLLVRSMWSALEKMGLDGDRPSRILEPAMGSGNFLGLAPEAVINSSRFAGVEIDPTSAKVAQLLYPDADIRTKGFEDTQFPDNFFDVVIGNIPFGKYRPVSSSASLNKRYDSAKYPIHDYFFAKSMDHVKPGGVVAFLTSCFTMDKANDALRTRIAAQADLLGAVRLPEFAHEAQAGTRVVTDMLFLRKRLPGDEPNDTAWTGTVPTDFPVMDKTTGEPTDEVITHTVNQYFVDHPEMVIGTMTTGHPGFRGGLLTVVDDMLKQNPEAFEARLQAALDTLPADVLDTSPLLPDVADDVEIEHVEGSPIPGSFVVLSSGGIGVVTGETAVATTVPKSHEQRVVGMIGIRDRTVEVLQREQAPDASDAHCDEARKALNDAYDAFVARHGRLTDAINVRAFRLDPRAALVHQLEVVDRDGTFVGKAEIFSDRVLRNVSLPNEGMTIEDAYKAVLAHRGRVDLPMIQKISGESESAVLAALDGQIYRNPASDSPSGSEWEPADSYLSGQVVEKLDVAMAAAATDPAFNANVKALTAVQPEPLSPSEITVSMGAPWQDKSDIRDFACHVLGVVPSAAHEVKVNYIPATGSWRLQVPSPRTRDLIEMANKKTWGYPYMPAINLMEKLLNHKIPQIFDTDDDGNRYINHELTGKAQGMQERLLGEFKRWIWEDPARTDRLTKDYNRLFNTTRLPQYDGSHLTFPGMNQAVTLHQHQKDMVWGAIQSGNALIAHEVGAGKTWEMVAIAYEWKRLGFANKPVITMPNHMLLQFSQEARQLYPGARILAVDKKDLSAANRQRFIAKVAVGNWDMVLMTHSSFTRVELSGKNQKAFIKQQIGAYREAIASLSDDEGNNKRSIKEIEARIKGLEGRLKKALSGAKDKTVTFEEMGIDAIIVDEAHMFKNLDLATSITGVAGLNTIGSQRSLDLLMKTRYLYQKRGGTHGVVFATGTPITNSIAAETYTLQRYLQPDVLARQGTQSFDSWASVFTEQKPSIEIDVSCSNYKQRTRLRMVNIPELLGNLRVVMDVKTQQDLKLPKPEVETIKITAPRSADQDGFMKTLAERVANLPNKKPWEDNMLSIATDGRKMSLDMRVVRPWAPDFEESKVNRLVANVHDLWGKHADSKATQLVFLDYSTPKGKEWSLYADIRNKLIAKGVPEKEVAFIHSANTDKDKEKLFEQVRAGEVRVLLGSTQKMGAGTNVQERLLAIHHLDAPWRPSDREQRLGRIARQGNTHSDVKEFIYTTQDSFDLFMWQTVRVKADEIHRIMHGDKTLRTFTEESDPTYAELMAITTGNPMIREKMELDNQIGQLSIMAQLHSDGLIHARQTAWHASSEIDFYKEDLSACWSILDQRKTPEEGGARWTYDDRTATQTTITKYLKRDALKACANSRYTLDGLTINQVPVRIHLDAEANLKRWTVGSGSNQVGYHTGGHLQTYITEGVDTKVKRLEGEIARLEGVVERAQEEAKTVFPDQARLDQLIAQRDLVVTAMDEASRKKNKENRPSNAAETQPADEGENMH